MIGALEIKWESPYGTTILAQDPLSLLPVISGSSGTAGTSGRSGKLTPPFILPFQSRFGDDSRCPRTSERIHPKRDRASRSLVLDSIARIVWSSLWNFSNLVRILKLKKGFIRGRRFAPITEVPNLWSKFRINCDVCSLPLPSAAAIRIGLRSPVRR